MVRRQSLWFEGRERVSLREEPLEPPGPGEVHVESIVSAISPGTEMLFYRGDIEEGTEVDVALRGYQGRLGYPLPYGYASVGRIVLCGPQTDPSLVGRLAFAFVPHASSFHAPVESLQLVPEGIEPEDAAFLATAETSVNLVLDSSPLLGEQVSVFGLGVIGLVTIGLLAQFPLARLTGWDPLALRREAAALLGARVEDPAVSPPAGATEDLAVEVSGTGEGLRMALGACRFSGRLIVGSWYGAGARRKSLDAFDTAFHRNRVRIIPSQVSTIDPALSARWTRERRLQAAWKAIRLLRPSRLITHRIPFSRAGDAYRLISDSPGATIQVILAHGGAGSRRRCP
jgi:2-desacetyl-2-hydroxyethyl bacteriochlorophyllide A dehydrogenase